MAVLEIKERKQGAIKFAEKWQGKGKEDEDYTDFWYDLLNMVYGVENPWECFKKQGKVLIEAHHKRMDLYVTLSKVVIEQKSLGGDLDEKRKRSDEEPTTKIEYLKPQICSNIHAKSRHRRRLRTSCIFR